MKPGEERKICLISYLACVYTSNWAEELLVNLKSYLRSPEAKLFTKCGKSPVALYNYTCKQEPGNIAVPLVKGEMFI